MNIRWWWKHWNSVGIVDVMSSQSWRHASGVTECPENNAGLARILLAAITPSHLTSLNRDSALSKLFTSPFATRGSCTWSLRSLRPSRSIGSLRISGVLAWTVRNEIPAFSNARHNVIVRRLSFNSRIFAETANGFGIRFLTWYSISLTSSGFFSRSAPYPSLMAQRCGHPQFKSTPSQYLTIDDIIGEHETKSIRLQIKDICKYLQLKLVR